MGTCPHCFKITDEDPNVLGLRLLFNNSTMEKWIIINTRIEICPICREKNRTIPWTELIK